MSRDLSHCEIHGEYMEFGPYYDCPQCRDERERSGSMADRESAEVLSQMKVALKMGELDALRLMEAELERLCPRLDKERTFLWVRRAVAKPVPVTAEVSVDDATIEECAQKIYERIPFDGPSDGFTSKPPWLVHGNSIRQGDARTYARIALKHFTAALKAQKGVGT